MKEGLLTAWSIHNEKNILLLKSIEESSLSCRLSAKGRTVGEQLAHMHNNRVIWIEFVAKNLFDKSLLLSKEIHHSISVLHGAFKSSGKKIEEVINVNWEKESKLPSFKTGLIPFVCYHISHESHHRGNILLTLKQSGVKLPDSLKWGLWEWAK